MEKSEVYPFDVVRRFFVSRWMRREETLKEVATYKFIHKKKVINTLSNVHSLKFIKIECSIAILFLNRISLSTFLNPFYYYIIFSSDNVQTFFQIVFISPISKIYILLQILFTIISHFHQTISKHSFRLSPFLQFPKFTYF